MIYVPGKFLFIHIPRTAGTSLSITLMRHLWKNVRVDTTPNWKHATAANLKLVIPDFHDIVKFAVHRDTDEIIESDYRLHHHCVTANDAVVDAMKDSVEASQFETLEQFRYRRWLPWIGSQSAWEHWIGNETVVRFEFDQLNSQWGEIMELCGLSSDTTVERLSL